MKKRLLLLAAVLTASANIMFADDEPVVQHVQTVQDSNGNTFTYHDVNDKDASSNDGTTSPTTPITPTINPNYQGYQLTLNSNMVTTISDRNIIYNVKLTNLSESPGEIGSFTEYLQSTTTGYDVGIQMEQIVDVEMSGETPVAFIVKENETAYTRYVTACERAIEIDNRVVKGNNVPETVTNDTEGMPINSSLYYMVSGLFATKKYTPILYVDGTYATGTTYSNSTVTYNPVGIADGYNPSTVSGEGKVGFVSGVVDNGRVEEILNNATYTYLNFDFANASVIGTLSVDIDDNRVAYFNNGVAVANDKGQNIVVGNTCNRYVISDNGQEIYVKKDFAAAESQYKRTFTSDTYGTIVLPFPVNNTGNVFVKKAELTSYVASENKLTFTKADMISPNTPYLFKVLSTVNGESTFSGPVNGTVYATAEAKSAKFEGAQFVGTFEGLTAQEASQVYVVGEVGKIGKTQKALKPGRCYLTLGDPWDARFVDAIIEIIDEDGSIETIDVDENDEKVTAIDGVVNGKVVSVQYISLNGQISSEPFSGINLVKKTFEDGSVETSKAIF